MLNIFLVLLPVALYSLIGLWGLVACSSGLIYYYSLSTPHNNNMIHLSDLDILCTNEKISLDKKITQGKNSLVFMQLQRCQFCKDALPAYVKLAEQATNVRVCSFVFQRRDNDKTILDGLISSGIGCGVPSYLLFDGNGVFVEKYTGGRDLQSLKQFVRTL